MLLNVINIEYATFEECVRILSSFENSNLCKRLRKLLKEKAMFPEIDYPHEINELKKQIEDQKKKKSIYYYSSSSAIEKGILKRVL